MEPLPSSSPATSATYRFDTSRFSKASLGQGGMRRKGLGGDRDHELGRRQIGQLRSVCAIIYQQAIAKTGNNKKRQHDNSGEKQLHNTHDDNNSNSTH